MQDYYAQRAREYDAIYLKPERQNDLREMETWLPAELEGRTVLEIACGTGYWTQFLAPRCAHVLALDAAPQTLEVARSRVPPATVSFAVGDAYALPASAKRFDAAFAGFWWSHIPLCRIGEFLAGLQRVLEPGACVVFMDNRFVAGSSTPLSQTDADGNTYQLRRLGDGSEHVVLKNFPSRGELLTAIAPFARSTHYREWQYFWALSFEMQ